MSSSSLRSLTALAPTAEGSRFQARRFLVEFNSKVDEEVWEASMLNSSLEEITRLSESRRATRCDGPG